MKQQDFQKFENGFVAITSAIVISVLLIIISSALSYGGFFARFNLLETEFKKESVAFAESCVDIARVRIANTAGYTGSSQENLDNDPATTECSYIVTISGSNYNIQSTSEYKDSQTNIIAVVTRNISVLPYSVPISSWLEVPNF